MAPLVRLSGITKRFGPLTALEAVDFQVEPGTIHALVGENGAGKTTLMRVLYGAITPDEGTIEVAGEVRRWHNSADAIAHGIGMVSQHYSVIPELTCLQNLALGAEGSFFLSPEEMTARADTIAARLGFSFDWSASASSLSPAGAQKLEISKLLWRSSKIMVLDEPTAMLSPADADALYGSLRQLAADGATVIVVTHRIPEVLQYADRVTVLRGGRRVADMAVSETDAHSLAEKIVGHAVASTQRSVPAIGEPALQIEDLVVMGDRRHEALARASLTVRAGEIVGVAGVDGNGQRELFHAIVGTLPAVSGTIKLLGRDVAGLPTRDRILAGLRLIPEDRHEEGLVEDWTLVENACLGLQRVPPLANGPWSDLSQRSLLAERVVEKFKTRHPGLYRPIRNLSGGNQQRFVAARALELGPRLVLAFQPTRGLDIDGAAQVFAKLREVCRHGAAALVVSFDLDELLENCDRTVVLRGGRLYHPDTEHATDRAAIGRLMVGAT